MNAWRFLMAMPVLAGIVTIGSAGEAAAKVVVKRTTVYVATLPKGCVRTTYDTVVVWRCGTTYYQAHDGRYVVVTIN